MKPTKLIPVLWTDQVKATIDFYTNTLGFICREKNDEWNWAALHIGEVELMVTAPNAHSPFDKPTFTGSFYFQVKDVDEIYEHLKDKVKIVYPLEAFEWGMKEFAINDNNGYILQFGQDIES